MNDELHVALDDADFLAVFPLEGRTHGAAHRDRARRPGERSARPSPGTTWDARRPSGMGIDVEQVNWFSTYRVHHRVAGRFQRGRAFLLGDAAHIHSPVGGQGMNTGIGDAVNLAWKLADVLRGRAPQALLDTYEPERMRLRAAARRHAPTARFTVATSPTARARVRAHAGAPARAARRWSASTRVRRFMFRAVSQTAIDYRRQRAERGDGRPGGAAGIGCPGWSWTALRAGPTTSPSLDGARLAGARVRHAGGRGRRGLRGTRRGPARVRVAGRDGQGGTHAGCALPGAAGWVRRAGGRGGEPGRVRGLGGCAFLSARGRPGSHRHRSFTQSVMCLPATNYCTQIAYDRHHRHGHRARWPCRSRNRPLRTSTRPLVDGRGTVLA